MATMIASGSSQLSPSLPVQEKGHRNKRKFRTEPPTIDPSKLIPSDFEIPNLDMAVKSAFEFSLQQHGDMCDLCANFCQPREEFDMDEYPDADWADPVEPQLEELVLRNLDMNFRSAIVKICAHGHPEDVATKAVLRSGICYGSKDTVANIVDNALAFLGSGKDGDSLREHFFEDLQQLEKYVLAEMVCVLREFRPSLSTGEAIWNLLVCDMNVSHACAIDGTDPLGGQVSDGTGSSSSVPQLKQENSSTYASSNSSHPSTIATNTQMPPVTGIPNLPSVKSTSTSNTLTLTSNVNHQSRETSQSSSHVVAENFSSATASQSYLPEEKLISGKKCNSSSSKRESVLRQKSVHVEKSYRAYKSKGSLRTGKLSSLGGLILDKKCKSPSDSTGINLKNASIKKNKSIGLEAVQSDGNPSAISFSAGGSDTLQFTSKATNNPSLLPATTNTELSLSIIPKTKSGNNSSYGTNPKSNAEIADYWHNCFSGIPADNMTGQWTPKDKKDEMMLNLVPRVQELQAQLQEWTEWVQHKVMQAARRLSKDKAELQTLRQEKEEVSRLKKEKQTLEENTMKKLAEMEGALSKASCQVEKADVAGRTLEVENARLRLEMEAAKLQAAESAANCQEVTRRETKTVKNFQVWEREKAVLREELMTEKKKFSQLQQQVVQAKLNQDQLESRCRQEEKVKDEILMQANAERAQREKIETSAKLKKEKMRLEAERDLQRYKDDIRVLENQVTQLRLKTGFSKAGALGWGSDGTYASRLTVGKNLGAKNGNGHTMHHMVDDTGYGDVTRDRECVMCLTEEMSVVFLPCAHQVVCNTCNALHEKQGMKDCPSCRAPIQKRISVRFADSKLP